MTAELHKPDTALATAGADALDDPRKRHFLQALSRTLHVGRSAKATGIARETAYAWRRSDREFAAAWLDIVEDKLDDLEVVAFERALAGSDYLTRWLLASHRPETYGPKVQHRVENVQRVEILMASMGCTRDEALQAIEMAERALTGVPAPY